MHLEFQKELFWIWMKFRFMNNRPLKNAAWIVGCKCVQSVLGLVISMFSARYLGPANYGLINYIASVVAFVIPVMQLGLRSTLVQEFIDDPDGEGKTLGTALGMNVISSIACMVGVTSFVGLVNRNEKTTIIVCALYSLNLLFQALEMTQYWFQAKLLSKYPSIVALIAYGVMSAYKIFLLVTEKSIHWFALSQSVDYAVIAVALLIIYKKLGGGKLRFSFSRARQMFSRSCHYIVSGLMVTVFQQTDRFMIKLMLGDEQTGFYSAAVVCAGITSFVFAAIIDSMRPVILEAKGQSEVSFETKMSWLYSIVFYLSLAQCIVMTVGAPLIIYILYGNEYMSAVPALQVIVWYVTYSYFGSVRNVWILAEGKQKYLWIINLSGAVLNVALNFLMIPIWGIVGASLASVLTQLFTNFILGFIMPPIRHSNTLMLRGMNPKFLISKLKEMI